MHENTVETRRRARKIDWDPAPLNARIEILLKKYNESFRQAGLKAGLDHQTIRRIRAGIRPTLPSIILLADHWEVNPNELIELAGWPTLKAFDFRSIDQQELPPETIEVARALAKIDNPRMRREIAEALLTLIEKYFKKL